MRIHRWLLLIWLCFLARAVFYCAAYPLWEGFDEWAHFAVVERMAFRGEALVSRDSPVPRDVAASLDFVPLAWELRSLPLPAATHDDFWRLPPAERERRERLFRAIPPDWSLQDTPVLKTYEGLQGPLSGWVMTPLLWAAQDAHLATQVLLLRWFGVTLASLVIPISFFACRAVFDDVRLGLGCAAIVAAMPGLLINTAHVANESVAVLLFTIVIWLTIVTARRGLTSRRAVALGCATGLALLAKAYALAALPPIGLVLLWKCRRDWRALLVPACALAVAGWWYARNLVTTGAISGMQESAMMPATLGEQLRQIPRIHWGVVIDSILFSHLWLGAWSTLTVRSWMYHVFYLAVALAAAGLVLVGKRTARTPALAVPALFFFTFWAAQLYHTIPMFMVWGLATTLGTYLYATVTAEVALCVAGLRALAPRAVRSLVAPFGVALFALLDLYTVHLVSLPYYTGEIAHRPGGPVAAFHPSSASLGEMAERVHAFKSPLLDTPVLEALWIAYLAATIGLVAIAIVCRSLETE